MALKNCHNGFVAGCNCIQLLRIKQCTAVMFCMFSNSKRVNSPQTDPQTQTWVHIICRTDSVALPLFLHTIWIYIYGTRLDNTSTFQWDKTTVWLLRRHHIEKIHVPINSPTYPPSPPTRAPCAHAHTHTHTHTHTHIHTHINVVFTQNRDKISYHISNPEMDESLQF